MYFDEITTPLGRMLLAANDLGLTHADWNQSAGDWKRDRSKLKPAREQLHAYFAGELTSFELPLAPAGSAFQSRVWKALSEIPFGETVSYGQLALRLGKPNGARAVGNANGSNPIAIIIPCHRVIGQNGRLTGYAGGLERKRALLAIES